MDTHTHTHTHARTHTHASMHTHVHTQTYTHLPGMGLYGLLVENCNDTVNICSSASSDTAGDRLSSYNHMLIADKQSISKAYKL